MNLFSEGSHLEVVREATTGLVPALKRNVPTKTFLK